MPDLYSSGDEALESRTTRALAVSDLENAFDMTRPKVPILDLKDVMLMTPTIVRATFELVLIWTQPVNWTTGADLQESLDDVSRWFLSGW